MTHLTPTRRTPTDPFLMSQARILVAPLTCAFVASLVACSSPAKPWLQVGGPLRNVSGMALVNAGEPSSGVAFLVVHDNKAPTEPHVGAVTFGERQGLRYHQLSWPANVAPPVDLEAICPIPGQSGSYVALTSAGRLLHLRYDGGAAIDVVHESTLPGLEQRANIEGFALQSLGGRTVAVWAERGDGNKPATLYWGSYDEASDAVTLQGQAPVRVPFPSGHNTRHVTDLRLDGAGVVWAAAASDPGNKGPFVSAVYAIGVLRAEGEALKFQPNPQPTRLWTFARKVEALELQSGARGRMFFGSDDEDMGGWLYVGQPEPAVQRKKSKR